MKIIIGHSNTDLDCIGSIVLARYLYPDHQPVRSGLLHPVAKRVQTLYHHRLNFLNPKDLKGESVDGIVIVDTRTRVRVEEFLRYLADNEYGVEIWDHHPLEESGFPDAVLHDLPCGANTSQLGAELMRRGVSPDPEDATIALSGIYADTGNFTHENVTTTDFEVASFLLESGASLKLVKKFLKPLSGSGQVTLFHELLNRLIYRRIHGHQIATCYWEVDEESEGLGLVVERVFEVENQDAIIAVFYFPKRKKTLLIGRNQKDAIDLHAIMRDFGGGGHAQAASANVKGEEGSAVFDRLLQRLELRLAEAATAADLMSSPVQTIGQTATLLQASLRLEEIGHTGLPVVSEGNLPVGFISLRDIMKARRAGQMHSPVKAFMSKKLVTASRKTTIREIERLLFDNNIGHLPIIDGGEIAGIVTRTDYLTFSRTETRRQSNLPETIVAT